MQSSDVGTAALLVLVIVAVWVALFLLFRQFVLWYFRINERTELLKDIRDTLRQSQTSRAAFVPPVGPPGVAPSDEVRRRPGESEDQFNSRVADQLQRQLRR